MQHLLKSIILGHFLVTSFCIPSYAEWDFKTLAEVEKYFLGKDCIDVVNTVRDIDHHTSAVIVIAMETRRRNNTSSIKVKELSQLKKRLDTVIQQAIEIQNQTEATIASAIAATDVDSISLEFVLEGLSREVKAAYINFGIALNISHCAQREINRTPHYHSACFW
jgi:hypothetical protein